MGSKIGVTTRADDGSETNSTAIAINSTALLVGEELTWDLNTMGKGDRLVCDGSRRVCPRIFLVEGFKKSTEPVLRACGGSDLPCRSPAAAFTDTWYRVLEAQKERLTAKKPGVVGWRSEENPGQRLLDRMEPTHGQKGR